jgi:hypothetical protein
LICCACWSYSFSFATRVASIWKKSYEGRSWTGANFYKSIWKISSLIFIFYDTKQVYVNIKDDQAHAVNTAWAMLALICAGQVCFVYFQFNSDRNDLFIE